MKTQQEQEDVIRILTALAAMLRCQVPSDDVLLGYVDALDDVPVEHLTTAARRHLNTSKFFPSIAELRDLAGAGDPTAADVWVIFNRVRQSAEPWKHPELTNGLQRLVADVFGGWRIVGNLPEAEVYRRFMAGFPAVAKIAEAEGLALVPRMRLVSPSSPPPLQLTAPEPDAQPRYDGAPPPPEPPKFTEPLAHPDCSHPRRCREGIEAGVIVCGRCGRELPSTVQLPRRITQADLDTGRARARFRSPFSPRK